MARARTMKLRRRALCESGVRSLLTNPVPDWGATLWAAGIERCAILVRRRSGSRAARGRAKAALGSEIWLMTGRKSGGVMAVARKEGLHRNWRSPPDPKEKSLGAR